VHAPDNGHRASRSDVLLLKIDRAPDGAVVVGLAGDLDRCSAPALAACLDDLIAAPTTFESLTIDASGLGFIDVGGLDVLVTAARKAHRSGRSLRLTGCSPLVLRLVRIVEVGDVFGAIEARAPGGRRGWASPATARADPPAARSRTLRAVDHQPTTCRPLPRRAARPIGPGPGFAEG
jgi:anti-anti-sigma factor